MSTPHWPRPQWRDSGDQAFLLWFVFGDFDDGFQVDAPKYRTRGTPAGIEVVRYINRELARWNGYPLAGTLGKVLYDDDTPLFERAKRAGQCVMLRGSLADPPDLDALRDLVGAITALAEGGGVAVVDPQMLSMFDPAIWRRRYFDGDAFAARDHVLILCNDDDLHPGRKHVLTRGLRKFARADLDIRNVPPERAEAAGALASQCVDFQARGGLIPDGHPIEIEGLAVGMAVQATGGAGQRQLTLQWPD